jgi:CRP/FNR family transcriptional regulator
MFQLQEIAMFSQLPRDQLKELESAMHTQSYRKNNIVFYEGEKSEYLHILLEGVVRLYKTNPKGTQVHLHNFQAPDVFAIFAIFEQAPFPASCEFLREGVVGFIPFKKIESCLADVTFSLSLISALSKRMKLVADLLHKETIFSAEAKIADLILHNQNIFEHVKKNKIAYLLNITPETLSRILTKLKKEKVISIKHCIVSIHKKECLEYIIETNSM